MAANPLFNSIVAAKRTNVAEKSSNQPVTDPFPNNNTNQRQYQNSLKDSNSFNKMSSGRRKRTDEKDESKRPEKRPKTDLGEFENMDEWGDDEWGDEELQEMENFISQSQQVVGIKPASIRQPAPLPSSSTASTSVNNRMVGRGTGRSQSTGSLTSSQKGSSQQGKTHYSFKNSNQNMSTSLQRTGLTQTKATFGKHSSSSLTFTNNPAAASKTILAPSQSTLLSAPGQHHASGRSGLPPRNPGGLPKSQLTPVPALTGSGHVSAALPGSRATSEKDFVIKQLEKYKEECQHYKREVKKLQDEQLSKDGQIKMLRGSLTQKEEDLNHLRQERLGQLDLQNKQHADKQAGLEKEIEKLKTTLDFKEHDLIELQNEVKKLEHKRALQSASSSGSEIAAGQSPRRPPTSPRVSRKRQDTSPKTPKSDFPTRRTFLADERSPQKNNKEQNGHKQASTSSSSSTLEIKEAVISHRRRAHRMRLGVNKGHVTGAALVSKVFVEQIPDPASSSSTGLVTLLQPPAAHKDVPERHPEYNAISPVRPKRTGTGSAYSQSITSSSNGSLSPVISAENYNLAIQGLRHLLQGRPTLGIQAPSDLGSLFSSESECSTAVMLLPLIEDFLSTYLHIAHTTIEPRSISPSGSMETLDSVTSSLEALMFENAAYANLPENNALTAVRILHVLVVNSPHVRSALLKEKGALIGQQEKSASDEETGMEIEKVGQPKKLSGEGTSDSRTQSTAPSSSSSRSVAEVVQDSQLLRRIIQLSNPQLPNNKTGNLEIVRIALQVTAYVIQESTAPHIDRFRGLFTQDILCNCLCDDLDLPPGDTCVDMHLGALEVLLSLANHPAILPLLCSQDDECVMSAIYSVAISRHQGAPPELITDLAAKVVQFVSSILSLHKTGAATLLEGDCRCSIEIVKSLVLMLHHQLQQYTLVRYGRHTDKVNASDSPGSSILGVLRQGVSMLHALAICSDKLFTQNHHQVEHQYVELICGLEELSKQPHLGFTTFEANAIHEVLWDFDQDIPGENDNHSMET